jgi:ketosteroid isomerase-like protein
MKKIFYLILLAVMIIAACQPRTKSVNLRADADTIRSFENQSFVAIQNSDKDKVMSFFSTNVVVMGPNEPMIVGLDNIRKDFESQFKDTTLLWKTFNFKIDTIEVSSSGDLAYARGTQHLSIKTSKGIVDDPEKFVDIFKKDDGQWKVMITIWNNDQK